MILLEMCKAMGVPYAYPLPLAYTEDEPNDEEDCEPKTYSLVSIKDVPEDQTADGANYLMNYQIFEDEKQTRPKLRTKIRKSHTR